MDCKEFEQHFLLYSKDKYDEIKDLDGFEKHLSTCEECFGKYSEQLSFERVIFDNWGEFVVANPVQKNKDKCVDELFDQNVEDEKFIEVSDDKFRTDDETFESLVEKAIADEKEGRLAEAIECLDKALEIRPNDEVVGMHQIRLIRISSVWEKIKSENESGIVKKIEKDLKLITDLKNDENMIFNAAEGVFQVLTDKAYLYLMYFNVPNRYKHLQTINDYVDGKVSEKTAFLDGSEVFGSQVQKFKTLYFLNGMESLLKFIIVFIDSSENRKNNEGLEFKLIQVPKIII